MAELGSFLLLEWPVSELVGALEDPPFVASLLDTKGCFEEVAGFLCPVLAPGFVPWETLSALEEVFGALKTTGLSKAHIASMWSVKGGYKSSVGNYLFSLFILQLKDDILPKDVGIAYVNAIG
ncbi:hypothetical protein Tco_1121563 [Tanacetum coccineum]|uniref:Uncharacterized protein n=1 Tax=Tanacetum coccineum TaxID=301880 RepID=A0ABQ5J0Z7_9ASTR